MSKEDITLNEVNNDGKTIYLYFNPEVGLYVAYGFSAFFAAHIVDIIAAYSEDLHMPVALMRKPDVSELRLSTVKHQHDYHKYYRLELKHALPLDDYARWVDSVKWK
ncbi:MAG: hypothetical protein J6X89_03765 [Bacteroidales bacterium]|nr:hypothetical protein [Bacteroidales bacterium]